MMRFYTKVVGNNAPLVFYYLSMSRLQFLESKLAAADKKFVRVLLSEVFPGKLALFEDVDW